MSSNVFMNMFQMIYKIVNKVYDNGLLTFNKSFRNDKSTSYKWFTNALLIIIALHCMSDTIGRDTM